MKAPIGIQLYSLRYQCEENFLDTLKKVKESGYDGVEFANYYDGMTAVQLKKELDRLGLKALSAHIPLEQTPEQLEELAAFFTTLETPVVNCSGSTVESDERVAYAREKLIAAAISFKQSGIDHGYHNHWAEFAVRNDQYILETMLRPSVRVPLNAQFDYAWMQAMDVDPVTYTRRWGNRLTPPHFKDAPKNYMDIDPNTDSALYNVEVGNGIIDFEAVLATMKNMGTLTRGVVVEQESFTIDPFDSIAISAGNIRRWMEKL